MMRPMKKSKRIGRRISSSVVVDGLVIGDADDDDGEVEEDVEVGWWFADGSVVAIGISWIGTAWEGLMTDKSTSDEAGTKRTCMELVIEDSIAKRMFGSSWIVEYGVMVLGVVFGRERWSLVEELEDKELRR